LQTALALTIVESHAAQVRLEEKSPEEQNAEDDQNGYYD
jgi:hypothetical protein